MKIPNKILLDTAKELSMDHDIIEEVIHHQWKSTYNALSCCSIVEVTGLARFKVRPNIISKRVDLLSKYQAAYENQLLTADEKKTRTLLLKIESIKDEINYITGKL